MIDRRGAPGRRSRWTAASTRTRSIVSAAGADVFVAGSAVFYSKDYAATIRLMREKAAEAERERS